MADELKDEIEVSVIVPTRNRSAMLSDAVEALWGQTFPKDRFEILLMDDSSTDDTAARISEWLTRSPCRMIHDTLPTKRGPACLRNTGARRARGRILAFTDDDCRPAPDWLERGVAAFAEDVAFVGGATHYKPEQVARARFFTRDGRAVYAEHPTYPWSNIFYRRSVFMEMAGSDERLCLPNFHGRVVDCGDTDLAWRVMQRGYRHRFVAELVVYHELEHLGPLRWVTDPFRLFVVPELIRRHPVLRQRLLILRLFFDQGNFLLYLAVLGAILGLAVHPAFYLLALGYPAWGIWRLRTALRWRRALTLPVQLLFLAVRQAVLCAGLLYGSLRFRRLVL